MIAALALLASCAAAQLTDPSPASVKTLHDRFIEAVNDAPRAGILETLSRTAPQNQADLGALYDLFMRFTDERVRRASLASLSLTSPSSPYLEPLVEEYLKQPEPESKLFAIKAALRLRDEKALKGIRALAKKRFSRRSADDLALTSERNGWWVQYEALAALAQWRPEEALPLIIKRSAEAPPVATLLGSYLWRQALPQISLWAASQAPDDRARAKHALEASVPTEDLRATRETMLAAMRAPKAPLELRHQFALKVGRTTAPSEIPGLLKEYAALSDGESKKVFAAALFATRDKQVVPLLEDYAKTDPDPNVRIGALVELKDLLPAKEFGDVAAWVEKNDPDQTNRAAAADGGARLGAP